MYCHLFLWFTVYIINNNDDNDDENNNDEMSQSRVLLWHTCWKMWSRQHWAILRDQVEKHVMSICCNIKAGEQTNDCIYTL